MQTFAPTSAVSAPPEAPATQPFNPNADPDFLAYRIFHSRPLQSIIDQVLANPDDLQMFSLAERLTNAFFMGGSDVATLYNASLQKKSPDDLSGAECLILYYFRFGDRLYLERAASKGVMYAKRILIMQYSVQVTEMSSDEINQAAAINNPHALVLLARDLIDIIRVGSCGKRLSEEELQHQFNNLQKAASLGEPMANRYLALLYCSKESDFKELTHILKKLFSIPNKQLAYAHYRVALKNGLIDGHNLRVLALELKLFGVAACVSRFAVENSHEYFPALMNPVDHPEDIYHKGTFINKFDKIIESYSLQKVSPKIKEDFNHLACTQTAFFLQLLSWETEPDQTRIFTLLSESAKQSIYQFKNHQALCTQFNALTSRADPTVSVAASPFSHWAQTNANASPTADMKHDSQGRVVTAKPSFGRTG